MLRRRRSRRPVGRVVVLTTAALTTVGLAVAGLPGTEAEAQTTDPPVVNVTSGRCLDVRDNTAAAGAVVQLWDCNGVAGQGWSLTAAGELRTLDGERCLDAYRWGTTPGTALISWPCTGGANQTFTWGPDRSLVAEDSGLCVSTEGRRTAAGSPVVLDTCTGRADQQWSTTSGSTAPTPNPGTGTPPASYPGPGRVTGATWAHDPTVVKRPDGTYLEATTGRGIVLKTSRDRTSWSAAGAAFPDGTPWTAEHTTGDLWAPDLTYANGQYYLYYSASTFGRNTSGIYLATSRTGESGTWTNQGLVISSTSASSYNAIDPDLIIDSEGRWWLSFGSFWSGIKLIEINPATGRRSGTAMHSLASRDGGLEAPDIIERNGYFYLFVSFDSCCQGASSTYRIAVGRSRSITGPYVDRDGRSMMSGGGTQILASHGSVNGPGHSAVLADDDGDVLFYHYYDDAGDALLGINLLGWDADGWPYVH